MISKKKKLSQVALICSFLPLLLCGCMGQDEQEATSAIDEDAWFAIADPIAENILQSIYNNDYQGYTRDFSQSLLDEVTQQSFTQTRDQLIAAMGQVVSRERSDVMEVEGGYMSVNYLVQFENGELLYRVVFDEDDETHKVEGVWFNNP
jgi:hypothetical protein